MSARARGQQISMEHTYGPLLCRYRPNGEVEFWNPIECLSISIFAPRGRWRNLTFAEQVLGGEEVLCLNDGNLSHVVTVCDVYGGIVQVY